MSGQKECTSCKAGDKEFPDWATCKILKAPQECRNIHGTLLCDDHAVAVMADWPEAVLGNLDGSILAYEKEMKNELRT